MTVSNEPEFGRVIRIATGLSESQRFYMLAGTSFAVRGVGAGRGAAATGRSLERKGLVRINRKHWRDHTAVLTPLGFAVHRALQGGQP